MPTSKKSKRAWTRRVVEPGFRHARLVVVEKDGRLFCPSSKYGIQRWKCLCKCGKLFTTLRPWSTKSCGCLMVEAATATVRQKIRLNYGESARRSVLASYKKSAKVRGLSWTISDADFYGLVSNDCYYCGSPPDNHFKHRNSFGGVVYGGIDRQDNRQGYARKNCVSCCKVCNRMKLDSSVQEFLENINRILLHKNMDYTAFDAASKTTAAEHEPVVDRTDQVAVGMDIMARQPKPEPEKPTALKPAWSVPS